jgi:CRISPR-associated protein Csd1
MSILTSLARAYERLPGAPAFGYSSETIDFVVGLNVNGTVANITPRGEVEARKKMAPTMLVPQPKKKSMNISPNFLWGNSAYVLGVAAKENKKPKRLADEHAAFVQYHLDILKESDDIGMVAFRRFLEAWAPHRFSESPWPKEIKDQSIVFALEDERLRHVYLHDRPAAKALWAQFSAAEDASRLVCLVTGEQAPIARLHPSIRGVRDAQSSGASIVSFNRESFTSYGHEQGDNAPVSEAVAFKYITTLNTFLRKDSQNRIQIGDATTIFWADASDAATATEAESIFGRLFGKIDEVTETEKVGHKLGLIVKGVPLEEIEPKLSRGVRFYVLGLSPNAARLSVRYWFEDDFWVLTRNYQNYVADMRFEPLPANRSMTTIRSLVLRTAPARRDRNNQIKFDVEQISPLLSGELFRAILMDGRFPGALLSALIMRVRTDHLLDSTRVSLIKAIIVRAMRIERRLPQSENGSPKEDYLVRSDPDDPNSARRLGRLFAVLERAQRAALGEEINTTIKDKFLGAAAATPQQVFVGLIKLSQHHLKRLRNGHSDASWIKDALHARRVGAGLERDIGRLWASFNDGAPAQHSAEEQGLFLVGYYQERFGAKANLGGDDDDTMEDSADNSNALLTAAEPNENEE